MAGGYQRGPATADQLARNGHIATALRELLEERRWSQSRLMKELGFKGGSQSTGWTMGKTAPGPEARRALAKLTGTKADWWRSREPGQVTTAPVMIEGPRSAPAPARPAPAREVMSFAVDDEGMARIKLDVRLDLQRATPLLRMLLDAGLVLGREVEA